MQRRPTGTVFRHRATRAAILACLIAAAAEAAVERLAMTIEIAADGSLRERTEMVIRLDDGDDVEAWRVYAVALDDHRQLIEAEAWRIGADGKRRRLGRNEKDEAEVADGGILFSSQRYLVFEPEGLEPGGRLRFETEVLTTPYFPAAAVHLQPRGQAVEELIVDVRSASGALRHRLLTEHPLELTAESRHLRLTGSLEAEDEPPALAAARPQVLRFAWGDDDSWPAVARWYRDLTSSVPRKGDAIDRLAAEHLGTEAAPRQRLEAAVNTVRRQIRYVAVEVGIGGYRPTPPAEVAERRWGDCKDKSLLLIELLGRAGLEARPALIRLDAGRRIDLDLPTPLEFNHLIVAVATQGLEIAAGDPVSDGWLFVDPTQTSGSAVFLHRAVQDQHALVITGDGGSLVRLPTLPHSEASELRMTLTLDAAGNASGDVLLRLRGETAATLTQHLGATNPTDMESVVRTILRSKLHGSRVSSVKWHGRLEQMPLFEARATIALDAAVGALDQGGSMRLAAAGILPRVSDLDELAEIPAVLRAESASRHYTLYLPEGWCAPEPRQRITENSAGSVRGEITVGADGAVIVSHQSVLERTWYPAGELADLRALAVAEHRAGKRRLRFACR